MSLLTNNNTLHLYNRWISSWYENTLLYSNLIYSDLYVYEFMNGIYYQLKMPSSIIDIKELNFNQIIIRLNLYIFKKRKQRRSSLFFNNKVNFFIFYKKMNYLLHKVLFMDRQYKKIKKYNLFLFNLKKIKMNIKQKNVLFLLTMKKKINKVRKLNDKNKYKKYLKLKTNKYLKNKKTHLSIIKKNTYNNKLKFQLMCYFFLNKFGIQYLRSINKNMYVFYLNNYYKINNLKNKYSKLIKYNNKNLLRHYYYIIKKKYYKKNIVYKENRKINIEYKNKKNKKIKLKTIKRKKIIYNRLVKNKKKKFSRKHLFNYFKNKKVRSIIRFFSKYNKKNLNLKYLNILKMKMYRKIFKNFNKLKKNKYIHNNKIRKFLYHFNKQKNNTVYNRKKTYLKKKLFFTKRKLILKKYRNKLRRKNFYKKKKKNRRLYFKVKKKNKKLARKFKKNKKINNFKKNIRKYKKKKSKKLRRILNHKNMDFYLFFWIYKKLVSWYYLLIVSLLIINHVFFYAKQKLVSLNFYDCIISLNIINSDVLNGNINLYTNKLIYLNKKKINKNYHWFNNFYLRLMLYHLRLKISNTLSYYLGSNVIFFPYYKKKFFILKDVKLMSDFIKLKLQYGRSIIRVLRKIIKMHNRQRFKLRIRNERYRLKMIFSKVQIRNRIILKFRKINSRENILIGKDKYGKNINSRNFSFNKKPRANEFKKLNNRLSSSVYLNKLNLELFNNETKFNLNNNKLNLCLKLSKILKKKKRMSRRKDRIRVMKRLTKWRKRFKYLNYKHYPLIGIRIECNGPSKKGRRTKMITYNEWVNYYKLPGKMPYSTKMADVHYWQSYARTKRAAIGIKVWLFFNTSLNSLSIGKARKNIKYR